jgi:hypothetical protein
MTPILALDPIRKAPHRDVVLGRQGIPQGHPVSERVERVAQVAISLYETLAQPKGILLEISHEEFRDVFEGEGLNTLPAPLPAIAEKANSLALFAATVGAPVSERIRELFEENDPATALMLDGIASERAEMAATLLAKAFGDSLVGRDSVTSDLGVLPYSPGYCGWHITGQRRLFASLKPDPIGISLSESCLMSPLKSVSGVLVAGEPDIHDFENDFDFCFDCATWECRTRIQSLVQISPIRR